MKKNETSGLLAVIGCVMFIVTISVYFLATQRTAADSWALAFVLLAECVFIGGLFWLKGYQPAANKVFIRSGLTSVLVLYFLITGAFSLFSGVFRSNLKMFVLIQILIAGAFIILAALIVVFSQRTNSVDSKTFQSMKQLEDCEAIVFRLLNDAKYKAYKKQLNTVYEAIHYRDKTVCASLDEEISEKLIYLEKVLDTEETEAIEGVFDEIDSLMKQRKQESSNQGREGF